MENQLPKITYLFGAGASALTMPTIKELPGRILAVKKFIEDNYIYDDNEQFPQVRQGGIPITLNEAKSYFLEGLEKLYNASYKHSTIDTYMKKLMLINKVHDIEELTFFLSLFFNIEQKLRGNDPRYDTFLISILDSSVYAFPENLKFLSWNYDLQLDIAYDDLLGGNANDLSFTIFNNIDEKHWEKNRFSSIKLNGSCNFVVKSNNEKSLQHFSFNLKESKPLKGDISWVLGYGIYKIKKHLPYFDQKVNIDFAWYKDPKFVNRVAELYSETQVLVVIGYSFPFFNREVDRTIIRAMNGLKKIYVQDKYPNNIMSRFLSILPDYKKREIEIIPVDAVDEFFLPPEL